MRTKWLLLALVMVVLNSEALVAMKDNREKRPAMHQMLRRFIRSELTTKKPDRHKWTALVVEAFPGLYSYCKTVESCSNCQKLPFC